MTQENFEIKKDDESGILKTIPQPKNIASYYESENYLSHSTSRKSFFAKCYDVAKNLNLNSKLKLFQRHVNSGSVLDIGAGMGDLVKKLNDNNFSAVGVEPNKSAREAANNIGIQLYEKVEDLNIPKYNAISMYHVLEHVPDIENQKKQILELLAPNGTLILALPNYKSLDAKIFGQYWAGYDVPRHLFHFNQDAVRQFFQSDFELIAINPLWFDSLYVSILSAKYKKLPFSFLIGIFIGVVSNFSAVFSKEYSSLTYVLKKRK